MCWWHPHCVFGFCFNLTFMARVILAFFAWNFNGCLSVQFFGFFCCISPFDFCSSCFFAFAQILTVIFFFLFFSFSSSFFFFIDFVMLQIFDVTFSAESRKFLAFSVFSQVENNLSSFEYQIEISALKMCVFRRV